MQNFQKDTFPQTREQANVAVTKRDTARLPPDIGLWSTRSLAHWLGVSVSTVKYHARQSFRGHSGRWELNREQAQRVANRVVHFGHRKSSKL